MHEDVCGHVIIYSGTIRHRVVVTVALSLSIPGAIPGKLLQRSFPLSGSRPVKNNLLLQLQHAWNS